MIDTDGMTRMTSRFRIFDSPFLLFLLAALFWSGNFVLARLMHADIPPVALAFWRWAGASIIVTGLAWPHLQRDWPELRRQWIAVLMLSLPGIAAMNTLLYAGLQWTTVVNASLLMALMPALVMLFSFLLFRERIRLPYAVGILLSLTGAAIVIMQGNPLRFDGLVLNRGDLLVFLATIFFAAYSVGMRYRPAVHPLSLMSITFSVGALCLLPLWAWEMAAGHTMTMSLPIVLTIGYLMLFPSVIAYFCFNRCIELVGSVRAGFSMHLVPVFSSLLGVLLLDEPFARYHAWGTVLIAVGILLTTPLIAGFGPMIRKSLVRLTTNWLFLSINFMFLLLLTFFFLSMLSSAHCTNWTGRRRGRRRPHRKCGRMAQCSLPTQGAILGRGSHTLPASPMDAKADAAPTLLPSGS